MRSELVQRRGASETYRFKHALVQDTAYQSLLATTRRVLHDRAARALEAGSGSDSPDAAIGQHLGLGNDPELAVPYLLSAGGAAERTFSNEEAVELYSQALATASLAPSGSEAALARERIRAIMESTSTEGPER